MRENVPAVYTPTVGDLVSWWTSMRENGSQTQFVGVVEKIGPTGRACGIRLPGRKRLKWEHIESLTKETPDAR
jgi:hypothetical protein